MKFVCLKLCYAYILKMYRRVQTTVQGVTLLPRIWLHCLHWRGFEFSQLHGFRITGFLTKLPVLLANSTHVAEKMGNKISTRCLLWKIWNKRLLVMNKTISSWGLIRISQEIRGIQCKDTKLKRKLSACKKFMGVKYSFA